MQQVREVVGQFREVAVADVAGDSRDADRVEALARLRVAKPCNTPYLVVAREVLRQRERDLSRRPGEQDLLAREHVVQDATDAKSSNPLGA
jgi:hypothetical protein